MNPKSAIQFLLLLVLPFALCESKEYGPKYSTDSMYAIGYFAPKLAKKYGLVYLNKGVGTIVDSNEVAWDIGLIGNYKWDLNRGRLAIISIVEDFLYEITSNPVHNTYVKLHPKLSSQVWFNPLLTPKRIGIKLAFWDENVDRPLPPYLAQIKVVEGKIFYYQANSKDQSLQEPTVETFEEAFPKVGKTAPNFEI